MAINDGAYTVAAGDEALTLQRGEDVTQLCTADAHLLRQDTFPRKTLTGSVFAVLHGGQQLGSNGFGLGRLTTHSTHLKY